jgi:predicted nucleotidyltransferase
MNPVIFLNRDPMSGFTRGELIQRLQDLLRGRVSACYVFGSFARNNMNRDSDVDLILIKPTEMSFLDRASEFRDLLEIGPRFDILVYTPEEFNGLRTEKLGFWKSALGDILQIL